MRSLLWISFAAGCGYLALILSHHANGTPLSIVLKVASTGLLLLFASAWKSRSGLLIAALGFSVLGDFLLEAQHISSLGPMQLFLLGLVSFLIVHLFYVALFLKRRSTIPIPAWRKFSSWAVLLVACVTLLIIWPGLAEMLYPVIAYSLVLTAMAITAQYSRFSRLVAIGALAFFASDTMLALSIFGHPFAGSRMLVWITYYAAQLMIALGILSAPNHERRGA
jgi:uncharacterized membrane protein YhhN